MPYNVVSAASRPSLHRLRGRETTSKCQLHHDSTILLHLRSFQIIIIIYIAGRRGINAILLSAPNYFSLCSNLGTTLKQSLYYIFCIVSVAENAHFEKQRSIYLRNLRDSETPTIEYTFCEFFISIRTRKKNYWSTFS